jgi:hypothetical protein
MQQPVAANVEHMTLPPLEKDGQRLQGHPCNGSVPSGAYLAWDPLLLPAPRMPYRTGRPLPASYCVCRIMFSIFDQCVQRLG